MGFRRSHGWHVLGKKMSVGAPGKIIKNSPSVACSRCKATNYSDKTERSVSKVYQSSFPRLMITTITKLFFAQSIVATWYVDSRNSFQRWLEIFFVFLDRMVRLVSPEAATSLISPRRLMALLRRTRIQERVLRFYWSRHKLVDHNPEF